MLPMAHFAAGLMIFSLLKSAGIPLELAVWALVGSIIIDVDFFFAKNHRTSPAHLPAVWFALIPAALVFHPFALFVLGVLIHLCLDTLDFGIAWSWPYSKKPHGGLIKINKEDGRMEILKIYIRDRRFAPMEVSAIIFAALLI
jgi:hypothetical protein